MPHVLDEVYVAQTHRLVGIWIWREAAAGRIQHHAGTFVKADIAQHNGLRLQRNIERIERRIREAQQVVALQPGRGGSLIRGVIEKHVHADEIALLRDDLGALRSSHRVLQLHLALRLHRHAIEREKLRITRRPKGRQHHAGQRAAHQHIALRLDVETSGRIQRRAVQ